MLSFYFAELRANSWHKEAPATARAPNFAAIVKKTANDIRLPSCGLMASYKQPSAIFMGILLNKWDFTRADNEAPMRTWILRAFATAPRETLEAASVE